MSNTRNHHYISQFYLRGFTKSGGQKSNLHVFDKRQSKYFKTTPRNVGASRDFNRVSTVENENYIEDELAKIEGLIAPSFKSIIDNSRYPTEEELLNILNFIGLTAMRNPKMRSIFDDFYRQIADKFNMMTMVSKDIYEDQARQAGIKDEDMIDYEEMKSFLTDKSRYTIEINQEHHNPTEFKVIETIVPLLAERNWYLIISNEETGEFITSDYPVTLISLVDRGPYGVGFGIKQTEVCFPISRYLALIGTFEDVSIANTLVATKSMLHDINGRTSYYANHQIYSAHKHFEYLDTTGTVQVSSNIIK